MGLFLDAVWQIMNKYEIHFQFGDEFLLFLIDSVYSCRFGTFIPTCERELLNGDYKTTESIWAYVLKNEEKYYNPNFCPSEEWLINEKFTKESWVFWKKFYLRYYIE